MNSSRVCWYQHAGEKKMPLSVGLEEMGASRHWHNEAVDVTWLYDVVCTECAKSELWEKDSGRS